MGSLTSSTVSDFLRVNKIHYIFSSRLINFRAHSLSRLFSFLFFFFNQPLTYARSGDVNIPSVLNRYRIFYKTLNLSQCSIMSSTFYHIFDGYWLCLDLSSSCVESNCFVIVPRGKTTYYGLVSLRLTREKGSVPCVTLVNLILLSDIEEIWVDGMDNSYVSAT